ncbi:hypothetical protein FOMPIDRAFT_1023369 [Fomitopsis schrenkii]|uniref:Calcineurin-like phosphoesterase domain-containing protein n=1 Tax=Fomitopsis schrenkii TaxID=2126942 RepID=S8E9I2_FOMSC|nr:hypothetical protein FOMPIDRAFT_1023369 [Fomitopsis schrenkii]
MAFSLFRVGRFLRSIFSPLAAFVGFSCLLTFLFVLYQPNVGPGAKQRVGWQSWETVTEVAVSGASANGNAGSSNIGTPSQADGVDWWNVTAPERPTLDSTSLPLDVWDPMLPHDTGLSEIEITRCFLDPWYAESIAGDLCAPGSTKEDDAYKGKWVRVPRNLNMQSGLMNMNIYYRRTRRHDIPLVTEFRVLPGSETPTPLSDAWHKVSRSISPSGDTLYLWYKTERTLAQMTASQRQQQLITELDVLFGDDDPWYGFEKINPPLQESKTIVQRESVWLTYRRGVQPPPRAPPLHFSRDGRFKIMQIADLHYSVSAGSCRDTPLAPCSNSDNLTNTLLGRMLDAEKPDFVVFSGDQLNGQGTSWDARSVLAKFAKAVMQRGIPWAAVFGNHDDEDGDATREQQIKYMQGLPYSMVERGPKDIHGAGNYVLKVKSADASMTHLLTMYFLDSGAYSKGFMNWFGFFVPTEYDWIHQDQINWFLQQSSSIDPIERPFTPDTAKDIGSIWERQAEGQVAPSARRLAKPNAVMFFHIPLEESYAAADTDPISGKPLDVGLHDIEGQGSAKKQDGFFHKGLLQAMESDHRAGGNAREVKVVSNGHCHVTENCRRVKGVWLCFGGGGSYSGYGKIGFDRRFRVYDVSDYGETIRTYKRTEHGEIVDQMILAGHGAPSYEGS